MTYFENFLLFAKNSFCFTHILVRKFVTKQLKTKTIWAEYLVMLKIAVLFPVDINDVG